MPKGALPLPAPGPKVQPINRDDIKPVPGKLDAGIIIDCRGSEQMADEFRKFGRFFKFLYQIMPNRYIKAEYIKD